MILGPNNPNAITSWVIEARLPSGEIKQFDGRGTFENAVNAMRIAAQYGAEAIRLGRPRGEQVEEIIPDFFAFETAQQGRK